MKHDPDPLIQQARITADDLAEACRLLSLELAKLVTDERYASPETSMAIATIYMRQLEGYTQLVYAARKAGAYRKR